MPSRLLCGCCWRLPLCCRPAWLRFHMGLAICNQFLCVCVCVLLLHKGRCPSSVPLSQMLWLVACLHLCLSATIVALSADLTAMALVLALFELSLLGLTLLLERAPLVSLSRGGCCTGSCSLCCLRVFPSFRSACLTYSAPALRGRALRTNRTLTAWDGFGMVLGWF